MAQKKSGRSEVEVLIAGSGPTGLMLATLLSEQNISFRIVDENPHRAKESRALVIQSRSLELLQKLGIVDLFIKAGMVGHGLQVVVNSEVAVNLDFTDVGRGDTPYPHFLFLGQSETERILEENLSAKYDVQVERSKKLTSFFQCDEMVTATVINKDGIEESVFARYLVSCEGARSEVREKLGLHFAGGTYEAEFMLADAKVQWDLPHNHLMIILGKKYTGLFIPLKNSDMSRVLTIGHSEEGTQVAAANLTTKEDVSFAQVAETFQQAYGKPVQMSDPQWVSRYRVHHRSVERMSVGRAFLAGDAAHIHSPAGGQGMNTGFQDAANLAWKLAVALRDKSQVPVLETYHSERFRIAQKLLKFTDRLFSMMVAQSPSAQALRNFLIPKIGRTIAETPFFKKYMFGFVSELNIHYHPSAAAMSSPQAKHRDRGMNSGDRLPDAITKIGQSIFEITKSYKFHVLVFSRSEVTRESRLSFEDSWKNKNILGSATAEVHWLDSLSDIHLLQTYGVEDVAILLVRPDGYIGYRTDSWVL